MRTWNPRGLENLPIGSLTGSHAWTLSIIPLARGEPGSMKAVRVPKAAIHARSPSATNSSPGQCWTAADRDTARGEPVQQNVNGVGRGKASAELGSPEFRWGTCSRHSGPEELNRRRSVMRKRWSQHGSPVQRVAKDRIRRSAAGSRSGCMARTFSHSCCHRRRTRSSLTSPPALHSTAEIHRWNETLLSASSWTASDIGMP